MSEESDATEEPKADVSTTDEAKQEAEQARLAKTFRLISGEEVLLTKRPSMFAFLGMYILGTLALGVHLFFHFAESFDPENPVLNLLVAFAELSDDPKLPFGFVFVMLFLAWMNRLINVSTSGRWVTIAILFMAITPLIIGIDALVGLVIGIFSDSDAGNFIPFDYSFIIFGLVYFAIFMGMTYRYQRSFHYAITTDAVIFEHSFLLSRSHRRILFDRISEVMVERTPVGTLFGFATVTILTDSGVGIVEESTGPGMSGAIPGTTEREGDSTAEKAGKGILRSIIGLLTYQRTIRVVRPDPKHCMYNIRNWGKAKALLNEKHKEHSQSNLLRDLKDTIIATSEDN
jgi:membrane protein YdbS with pleckstrin-like domain